MSRVGGSEEGEEVTCVGSSQPHKLGPMDKWTKAIDSTATKSESLSQQKLNKELWKERLHEVHKYIARWVFNHGNFLAVFLFQISISSDFLVVSFENFEYNPSKSCLLILHGLLCGTLNFLLTLKT